jgi:DNA helicase-2/ATP-dependent DNA helicase PcrA
VEAFEETYKLLNKQQKQAVDTIDGPLLVIAGPGTGKTQLLSARVAQILRRTDTLPQNILCLTFTDNAAANMRDRLVKFIGSDAYQVGIHTFNAFGSRIMNMFPQYFNQWRETTVADELTSHRILEAILAALPGDHPLAGRGFDGKFYVIKQLKNLINDAKRSNVSPDELKQVLQENADTYRTIGQLIRGGWPAIVRGQAAIDQLEALCDAIGELNEPAVERLGLQPIKALICTSLEEARQRSRALESRARTKPFTEWKDAWLAKAADGTFAFADQAHLERLLAATDVYAAYQQHLQERAMADFSDQIVTVLNALEQHEELRLNLQERFQYVMIDEYQDTNRAQLQLTRHITDAAIHEGRPNIMVVGDDDQAIYKFQGADLSNVEAFEQAYRDPVIVTLTDNYRSNQPVIEAARTVNAQIERSFQKLKGLDKPLKVTVKTTGSGVQRHEFRHESQQYAWVAHEVERLIDSKQLAGSEIAILARERNQLDAMVPYLRALHIPIDYERRENILEQRHIVELLNLARLINAISKQDLETANQLLPAILSHPMWQLEPAKLWRISAAAYRQKCFWLDVLYEQADPALTQVADFLLGTAGQAASLPLEQVLDSLIGTTASQAADSEREGEDGEKSASSIEGFVSPFKAFYFPESSIDERPTEYLTLLSHLAALRSKLRTYQTASGQMLYLDNCLDFVDSYERAELLMLDTAPHREDQSAIRLMTAHKAKGLEFDAVFVIGVQDDVWQKKTGGNSRFSYPHNLRAIRPVDSDLDDALRLLFVSMTRARQHLYICNFRQSDDGNESQPFAPLLSLGVEATSHEKIAVDPAALTREYEERWLSRHASVTVADRQALLADRLATYQLSATHLNNFLNVGAGGPLYFLTQNFLHFPSSMHPSATYGTLMHHALRRAHESVVNGRLDIASIVEGFLEELAASALSDRDKKAFAAQGTKSLQVYLQAEGFKRTADEKAEFSFTDQGVVVGQARLKGEIDLITPQPADKSVIVTDYKTGEAFSRWELPPSAKAYNRIKLHKYRNQLLFYKLLIDGSAEFGRRGWRATSGILAFVEPDNYGRVKRLSLDYDEEEVEKMERLVKAVWEKIQHLDFPDTSAYSPDLSGMLAFEDDLRNGKV